MTETHTRADIHVLGRGVSPGFGAATASLMSNHIEGMFLTTPIAE